MVVKKILPNGLTLITEPMPDVRSVAIGIWVKRGSRHETARQTGISHFIEHMVFKGTRNRTAARIASEMDSIGGHMDAFTAKEYAAFHLKVLDEHVPLAIDILADIVKNPLFDRAEMTREMRVIFEEIHMVEDTPDDLVMELFVSGFWPDHPLGRPILGTKRSLRGISQRQLRSFFAAEYSPGNIVVAAAGHVEARDLARLVTRHFADLRPRAVHDRSRPPRPAARIITRNKPQLEQVHLCLGVPAPPLGHADRYAVHVMNTVLGGSMSSRLFQNVRERQGLVYTIGSGVSSYSDAGIISVYAGTSPARLSRVIASTLTEWARLRDSAVEADELRRAKDQLKGSLMLSLENTGSRMNHIARQEINYGVQQDLDDICAGIEAVEADDLQRVAGTLFSAEPSLSVVGPLDGVRLRRSDLRVG